jgi:hypothetical protein
MQPAHPSTADATIHVIPYAHLDVAWVHSRAWHVDRYVRLLDEVLERLDCDPDYAFYLDTWTEAMKAYSTLRPANFTRLRRRIKQGRIALCGGHYGNVRSTMVGDETFIRNLQLGLRNWRRFLPGLRTTVYANQDVTIGHSQLPQLLHQAGFKGYFADRPLKTLDQRNVPRAFQWEGLSGDRLLVCRAHYGGLYIESERHGAHWGDDWPAVAEGLRQTYLDAPARHGVKNIAMCIGSDDARPDKFLYGYDRPCNYTELIDEWNKRESGHMQYSTPDRLFSALEQERDLQVVAGVLDPADVCYNTAPHGRRGLWWLRELADRRLTEAERLATLASVLHGQPYPEKELVQAWEQLLDTTPHAVQWVFRESWHAAEMSLRQAIETAEQIIGKAGATLAGAVLPLDGAGLALVNTVAQPRHEVLPIWLVNSDLTRDIAGIVDADGNDVPMQVIEYPFSNCECLLLAEVNVPACGQTTLGLRWTTLGEETPGLIGDNNLGDSYNDYWKSKHAAADKPYDPDHFELRSDCIKVKFEQGRLVSVRDLQSGVTRKASREAAFLEPVHYAMDSPNWFIGNGIPENPDTPTFDSVRIDERGPLRWRVTRTGTVGGYWFRQHLDLIKGLRGVRSTLQFLAPAENRSNLIGLSVPLSTSAVLRADIPFGVEERNLDQHPYGIDERLIPGMLWARTWVAARDRQGLVALVALDGDKFFRDHGHPRRLVHFLARRTEVFEKGWENYIDTQDLGGRQRFEHELLLDDAEAGDRALLQRAETLRHPVQILNVAAESLGRQAEWLSLTPDTVQLQAFHIAGPSIYLRITQMAAAPAQVEVSLPFSPREASRVDLDDQPLKARVQRKGHRLRLELKPWEIATLKLMR